MVNRLKQLSFVLAPGLCRLCRAPSGRKRDICSGCEADLPWLGRQCQRCALPLDSGQLCGRCLRSPPHFDHCFAAWTYGHPIDRFVTTYKHQGKLAHGELLAELWCAHNRDSCLPVDGLVPVPLHWRRLLWRGFNQADYLAKLWSARLGIPVIPALKRPRATASQQKLSAGARRRNLRAAFQLRPGLDIEGLRIALIDDVLTTGATAHAAAGILRRAGARQVDVWCLARTP